MGIDPDIAGAVGAAIGSAIIGIFGGAAWSKRNRATTQPYDTEPGVPMQPCKEHGAMIEKLAAIPEIKDDIREMRSDMKSFMVEMRRSFDDALAIIRRHEGRIGKVEGKIDIEVTEDTRS